MDESCLPQSITAPFKILFPLQRLKESHWFVDWRDSLTTVKNTKFKARVYVRPSPSIKWMNSRASTNEAYVPTPIEHMANVATHGIWVVPSIVASLELVRRSSTWTQLTSACVYGTSLILIFAISTFFHTVHYYNSNKHLKDTLHRCDRAMIYIFIAASYFPWLNVEHFPYDDILSRMRYVVWIMATIGILYQQIFHERYKLLETVFYLVMGIGPSLAVIRVNNYYDIGELKVGGALYVLGLIFFKSDGRIPCAHAIWHLFVATAAAFHYYAILSHVFPAANTLQDSSSPGLSPLHDILESRANLQTHSDL